MTLQISASLFLGTYGDDVARVHQALQALGRSVPVGETKVRALGAGTVAVLKGLQAELGLAASGIVDAVTVKAINVKLAELATDLRIVRGSVLNADGSPFAKGFVQIFSQGPNGEQVVGKSSLNPTDGSYQISYRPPTNCNGNGRVDIRVAVLSTGGPVETIYVPVLNTGGLVETTPSGASILTDAGPLEVVDFVLSGEKNRPLPEFELLLADLKPHLGARALADLTEDGKERYDVSRLVSESGYSSENVSALVLAHKLAKETGEKAEILPMLGSSTSRADNS